MGVSLQVYAVTPARLSMLRSDAGAAAEFMTQNYGDDARHDHFETLSLDKSGMGILEACGVIDQSSEPPESWVLGAGPIEAVPEQSCGALDSEQTVAVADWISTVTDEEFAERVESNMIDNDVEYLVGWFATLRDFYGRTAHQGRAVLVYFSG
ncbi:MAG: DUF1877 family protein [Ilumatobacter sp.]|uniref:DUF1877 family protein n=1 Tax=Ilumatobacter sp. TaxID=1967498 RepID=UPI003C722503